MSRTVYQDGILRARWDDTARTYTEWDANGTQTVQRPYTPDENAAANESAHAERVQVLQREQAAALAALTPAETDELLNATSPPAGDPWRQPSGAYDAYPTGALVTHNGQTWESMVTANVWEPGVSAWQVSGVEWPAWVQPTGSHDAYQQGAKVSHNGLQWISSVDGNVWEPGVHGWVQSRRP